MKGLHIVAFSLVIVGALNWGLTALGVNIVDQVLGSVPQVAQLVYLLIGVSGVVLLSTHRKDCKTCG